MHKKIVILATESSGDFLGFRLIQCLKKKNKNIKFFGIGGNKMETLNFKSLIPLKKLAVNGIIEVFFKIFKLMYYLYKTKKFIKKINPEIIISIDSPSFNYRIVKDLQSLRPRTKFIHYVAPTVWAWKKHRAYEFSKVYDQILTLFSFEPQYFKKFNIKTSYVGHPIFFEKKKKMQLKKTDKEKIITFFPGSRLNEIKYIFPKMILIMKHISKEFPQFKLKIISVPHLFDEIKKRAKGIKYEIISSNIKKKKAMENSFFAFAASGTVTLELSFLRIPMIVVYDSNIITSFIIKRSVQVQWASIINIIFNRRIVPEYLFDNFTVEKVYDEFLNIINSKKEREKQKKYFKKLEEKLLFKKQNPSKLATELILGNNSF